ncbi:MAG TPA: alpha/beta hydrolase [Candidatus Nitrosocosmicus sp.]|nr:alpha/beta hydrolase [Candidatus Nitrosocosmicus sp.]
MTKLAMIFSCLATLTLISMLTVEFAWSQFQDIPTVSTRNHFDVLTGEAIVSDSIYNLVDNNGELSECPSEVVLYIHGVWVGENSLEKPSEVFDRLKLSLQINNYTYPLIGYTWDSDTDISFEGWNTAKKIAAKNGEILAIFIDNYKQQCPQTEIRIIAHSLGARVALEALEFHNNGTLQNSDNSTILSIHLVGAAVDDEEVSTNSDDANDDNLISSPSFDPSVKSIYGNAIETQVTSFYNLYNLEDDVLEPDAECLLTICQPVYYPKYEGDFALGQSGAQPDITLPNNYRQMDVADEISFNTDANGDGNCDLINPFEFDGCTIYRKGDNHFGYIGFRANEMELIDDGVISKIVDDWTATQ